MATIAAAGLVSFILTGTIRWCLAKWGIVDLPSVRGLHSVPIVRGAGLAFALSWIGAAIILGSVRGWAADGLIALIVLACGVTVIGFCDDVRQISAPLRLVAQLVVCSLAVVGGLRVEAIGIGFGLSIPLGVLSVPVCVLGLVAMVNVFNFMDGIDGLVASQTVVAATLLACGMAIYGQVDIALLAVATAASVGGFLPFNWSPARCFMGDAGSYFCGGVLAGLLLMGQRKAVPLALVNLPSAAFVLDAVVTLARRLLTRQPILLPHRSHIYQRLVVGGWSHAKVASLYAAVAVVLGGAALVGLLDGRPAN